MSKIALLNSSAAVSSPGEDRKVLISNLSAFEIAFSDSRKHDQSQADLKIGFYLEALEAVPDTIAIFTTRRFRLFNPRNPWSPTAQDLREYAVATVADLSDAVGVWAIIEGWAS